MTTTSTLRLCHKNSDCVLTTKLWPKLIGSQYTAFSLKIMTMELNGRKVQLLTRTFITDWNSCCGSQILDFRTKTKKKKEIVIGITCCYCNSRKILTAVDMKSIDCLATDSLLMWIVIIIARGYRNRVAIWRH